MESNLEILDSIMKPYFDKKKEIENVPFQLEKEKQETANAIREMRNERINRRKELELELENVRVRHKIAIEDFKEKMEKEIEEYIKNISLKGFGGTDFRPVFQYVDEIFTSSQKNEVNGLIYFTDGDGTYPKQMPKFKSLFVINDSCFDKSKMPLWAISLFLDSQDLIGW